MSAPFHHPKDLDAALMYAPPSAREAAQAARPPAANPADDETEQLAAGCECTFIGDRAMIEVRRRLALDPRSLPEPPLAIVDDPVMARLVLRIGAVVSMAALIAWGVVAFPPSHQGLGTRTPALLAPAIAAKRIKLVQVRVAAIEEPPPVLAQDKRFAAGLPSRTDPPDAAAKSPDPVQAVSAAVSLDRDELATLLKRGTDYLTNGDFSSARLLLRRAAEAGSAEAALALGASFDPLVIARLGAVGAEPDIALARKWYRKAETLGSESATRKLAELAQARP